MFIAVGENWTDKSDWSLNRAYVDDFRIPEFKSIVYKLLGSRLRHK